MELFIKDLFGKEVYLNAEHLIHYEFKIADPHYMNNVTIDGKVFEIRTLLTANGNQHLNFSYVLERSLSAYLFLQTLQGWIYGGTVEPTTFKKYFKIAKRDKVKYLDMDYYSGITQKYGPLYEQERNDNFCELKEGVEPDVILL